MVIDGVGYPSVGSIVGCSSADIAEATGANVLLVGKPGVGDAIDSYNLCAAFFEARGLPVLGAVFNKLPETGTSPVLPRHRYRVVSGFTVCEQWLAGSLPRARQEDDLTTCTA